MSILEDLIMGGISDKEVISSQIPIYSTDIDDSGNIKSIQSFDIPSSKRDVQITGDIEGIYNITFFVEFKNKDKVASILSNGRIYLTFPTKNIINEIFFVFSKSEKIFSIKNLTFPQFTIQVKKASLSDIQSQTNIIDINSLRTKSKEIELSTFDKIANFFSPVGDVLNLATSTIISIGESMQKVTQTFARVSSGINLLQNTIVSLSGNIYGIISIPSSLAGTLELMISDFNKVADNTIDQANIIKTFFTTFNFTTYNINGSTLEQDNYNATQLINSKFASSLFASYCENISASEFSSLEEIYSYENDLELIYDKTKFIDDIDLSLLVSTCKNLTNILLSQKKQTIKPFTIINVQEGDNLIDFCYRYYGNLDNIDNILNWNPLLEDMRWLQGDVKIIL